MTFVSFVSYPPTLEIPKNNVNLGDTPTDKTDESPQRSKGSCEKLSRGFCALPKHL